MPRLTPGAAAVVALVLSLTATGCGARATRVTAASQTLRQCRSQWHDVGQSVAGLDAASDPSALASRWNSVIATVGYYETAATAKNCQASIDTQVNAITQLRDFSVRLRPYDMAYQSEQAAAAVDLYENDPLPAPSLNAKGKKVPPPSKVAVSAAAATLGQHAAQANTDLAPAWAQFASVELTDAAAVQSALSDLDTLARQSPDWTACNQALAVILAAEHAQQGPSGSPSDPSLLPSTTPTATPRG